MIDDNVDEAIGGVIREMRKDRGLTLDQVSQMLGIQVSTQSRREAEGAPVVARDLWRYARILGVPVHEIIRAVEERLFCHGTS